MSIFLNHEGSDLRHEENLAFLREGKGGLTLGAAYYGTEEQYRQAHGLDIPEAHASAELGEGTNLRGSSAESEPSHETIIPLLPGVAVFCGPGAPVPFSEGARWLAPGDFKCFLEAGDDNNPGLFRELLVGPFRVYDNDNDHELPEGNFLDERGWDEWMGNPQRVALQLAQQIGFDPSQPQPDDALPRGESWLADRESWQTENQRLVTENQCLVTENERLTLLAADFQQHLGAMEAKLLIDAQPGTDTQRPVLPGNALERLVSIKGISEKLAVEVLSTLFPEATPTPPVQS